MCAIRLSFRICVDSVICKELCLRKHFRAKYSVLDKLIRKANIMGTITSEQLAQRSSLRASAVWGLAVAFYFYELMLLVSPSVMLNDLAQTFNTSAEQLGTLAAYYYYAYALMQIPVGLLIDRFGPRILLTIAACLCAVGCVIFGTAQTLLIAKIGRFVMGMGGAFAVVGCLKLASLWFAVNRFALLTGIMVAVGMMGGVFGQAPIAKVVLMVGWRQTVLFSAITGLILSFVIWMVVADRPFERSEEAKKHLTPFAEEVKTWLVFASVVIAFCLPFSLPEKSFSLLFFYGGWIIAQCMGQRLGQIRAQIRMPLAVLGAVGGIALLWQGHTTNLEMSILLLLSGFFARGLFGHRLPIPEGLLEIMRQPQAWVVSLYAGLMFVPTTGFGQLWGVPYFMERFQIDKVSAGGMVSMIFFGWAFGGPLYGWISDRIKRRKFPMAFAAIGTLMIMSAILFAPVTPFGMKLLMFLLGACSSGFILAFSIIREINIPILTGTAIGFMNTLNNASGALAQPIVGMLLDNQWTGERAADGSAYYSIAMFNHALIFLPICIFVALILLPFIRETHCKPVVHTLEKHAANDA